MTKATTKKKTRREPFGRPTKLTPEIVEKARRYIDVEIKLGGLYAGDLPTVAGLAIYLKVARSSIYEWADDRTTELGANFSDTLEDILAHQQYMLQGKTLKGEYNPTIAKMMLNVNHDMVERTKTDVTTDGEKITNPYTGLTTAELKKLARGK